MKQGAEQPGVARAASPLMIVVALVLLGHAALALAGVFETAAWVPVLECLAVCAIGLAHLRSVSEPPDAATGGEPSPEGLQQPVVPGRVAAPIERADRVAGA